MDQLEPLSYKEMVHIQCTKMVTFDCIIYLDKDKLLNNRVSTRVTCSAINGKIKFSMIKETRCKYSH